MKQADHQVQHHHQSEVDKVDAQQLANRHQNGDQNGDSRCGFQKAADKQHQQVGQQQENPGLFGEVEYPFGNCRSDASGSKHPPENAGCRHNEQYRGSSLHSVHADLDKHLPGERAVPGQPQHHGPNASGDGAFGGCKNAGGHAADQQHGCHDRQNRLKVEKLVCRKQNDQPNNHCGLRGQAELGDQQPDDNRPHNDDGGFNQGLDDAGPLELDVCPPTVFVCIVGDRGHH